MAATVKTKFIGFRVIEDLAVRIKQYSKKNKVSESEAIRQILDSALPKKKKRTK